MFFIWPEPAVGLLKSIVLNKIKKFETDQLFDNSEGQSTKI